MKKYFFFALIFAIASCNDDDVLPKGTAKGKLSFGSTWEFTADFYDGNGDGKVAIRLYHNDSLGLVHLISFTNIPFEEDSVSLLYTNVIVNKNPEATYWVKVGDDAVAESYNLDSTDFHNSYIILDKVKNRRIEGRFKVYFSISKYYPAGLKEAPYIPDNFVIEDGVFTAEKL